MSKSGAMWLEAYEDVLQRFKDRIDSKMVFIDKMRSLGCTHTEIGEAICNLGMVGTPMVDALPRS